MMCSELACEGEGTRVMASPGTFLHSFTYTQRHSYTHAK